MKTLVDKFCHFVDLTTSKAFCEYIADANRYVNLQHIVFPDGIVRALISRELNKCKAYLILKLVTYRILIYCTLGIFLSAFKLGLAFSTLVVIDLTILYFAGRYLIVWKYLLD